MAKSKKKVTTAVVAGVTAVALLLGGTFAWQSINQTALNEVSDSINPGGRLHDDFDGSNKDVYVENFAEDPIFARVRLDEYFEIVMNQGTDAEKTEVVVGGTKGDTSTYATHYFDAEDAADSYWDWTTGGSTTYMPTFNKDKDSLKADINGTYDGLDADDDIHYDDYEAVPADKTADAIYDADTDNLDNGGTTTVEETHYATETLGATLMSMQKWIDAGSPVGEYWVYDTDGWVYWADAIQPGTATGLLLDGIELTQVMDDSWYYAINVVAQFVTADDLGKTDGTGFYDTQNGTEPSADALALLKKIGVDVPITNTTGEYSLNFYMTYSEDPQDKWDNVNGQTIQLYENRVNQWYTLELPGVESAVWSVDLSDSLRDIAFINEGEPLEGNQYHDDVTGITCQKISFYDCNAFGTAVITAEVEGVKYTVTLVVNDTSLYINDLKYNYATSYVFAGAGQKLSVKDGVAYKLISEGHAAGTYIEGDMLYVDENETVAPVIEVTLSYGGTVIYGNDPTFQIKTDSWLLFTGGYEPSFETYGGAKVEAYYNGEKVYVRLNETDTYTNEVYTPTESGSHSITVEANTSTDGTGETKTWNLFIFNY